MGGKTDIEVMEGFFKRVKSDFADAQILLFGSRAKGSALEESDFDIIIVSKGFEKMRFFDRAVKIYDYWKEKKPLEAFCYTPKEFEEKRKRIGMVKEAAETGKTIS